MRSGEESNRGRSDSGAKIILPARQTSPRCLKAGIALGLFGHYVPLTSLLKAVKASPFGKHVHRQGVRLLRAG
jgi:hypothetical protein